MPRTLERAIVPCVFALAAGLGLLLLLGGDARRLATDVIGLGGDPYQTLWRFSALTEALTRRSLSAVGEPFRNFGPLPWIPLHLFAGEPLGYNLVWLAQGPLTVLSVFWLGRRLGISPVPASVAGLLAAFAPYRLAQGLGHFGAMQIFWIPATLAAFLGWLKRPTLARSLVVAILLIGTSWTEHTLFLAELIALALCAGVFRKDLVALVSSTRGRWSVLLFIGLVFTGVVLPFRSELTSTISDKTSLNPGSAQRRRFSPTFWSLVSPASFQVFRRSAEPYGSPRTANPDAVHAIGLLSLGAALAGALKSGGFRSVNGVRLLILLAIAGIILSVLPRTYLGAELYDITPVFSSLRAVNRFLVLPVIALSLLAARALPRTWWGMMLVGGALLVELLPARYPLQVGTVPAYAAALRPLPRGAVLEAGSASDYLLASRALYASSVHGRKVIGHSAFARVEPPQAREAILRVPGVRDLLLLRVADLLRPTFFGQEITDLLVPALVSEGIAAVLVHDEVAGEPVTGMSKQGITSLDASQLEQVRAVLRASGLGELALDAHTSLFAVPLKFSKRQSAVAIRGAGWERVSRRADGTVQSALSKEAGFTIRVTGDLPAKVSLTFTVASSSRASVLSLRGGEPAAPIIARPRTRVVLPLGTLYPGDHEFTLLVDTPGLIVENPTVS